LEQVEFEEVKGKSESFGMPSVYQKSVQYATMDTLFPLPPLPVAKLAKGGRVPPQYTKHFVFALLQGGKLRVFSWLQPDVFHHLASPDGKEELSQWLGALELDEVAAMDNLAWTGEHQHTRAESMTTNICNSLILDIKSKFSGMFSGSKFSGMSGQTAEVIAPKVNPLAKSLSTKVNAVVKFGV